MNELAALDATASRLGVDDRLRLWARLAHNLTVCARETYAESAAVHDAAKGLNEVLHRVTAELVHLAEHDARGFGADLINVIREHAENWHVVDQLEAAARLTLLGWKRTEG